MVPEAEKIFKEMYDEAIAGRRKYGGDDPKWALEKDLQMKSYDWIVHVKRHLDLAAAGTPMEARQHLIKAGGLVFSAVYTKDINEGRTPKPEFKP